VPLADYAAIVSRATPDTWNNYPDVPLWQPSANSRQAARKTFNLSGNMSFKADPVIIAALPATELAAKPKPDTAGAFMVDAAASSRARIAYSALDWAQKENGSSMWSYLEVADTQLAGLPKFRNVAAFEKGNASFGTPVKSPILNPPDELKGLYGSQSMLIILQLAFSISDLPETDIQRISFRAQVDSNMSAVEMLPFRYEPGGQKPTPGPVFTALKAPVVIDSIEPKVVAYGIQDHEFFWELTGAAASNGAHRFISLLVAPRNMNQLTLTLSLACQMKPTFLAQGKTLVANAAPLKLSLLP
jgi:hypothetical protein